MCLTIIIHVSNPQINIFNILQNLQKTIQLQHGICNNQIILVKKYLYPCIENDVHVWGHLTMSAWQLLLLKLLGMGLHSLSKWTLIRADYTAVIVSGWGPFLYRVHLSLIVWVVHFQMNMFFRWGFMRAVCNGKTARRESRRHYHCNQIWREKTSARSRYILH